MNVLRAAIGLCVVGLAAGSVRAQAPTTVQLPSFHFFTVNTSVMVPDRGTMVLGGIGGSGQGSYSSGPGFFPGNRATGSTSGASQMSIHVQIHDLHEMDELLLAQSRARAGLTAVQPPPTTAGAQSVADAKREHAQEQAQIPSDAAQYFARGQAAEAQGQTGAAKVWYQMASRRATGELKTAIDARYAALLAPKAVASKQ
jgi:hypothetical protein